MYHTDFYIIFEFLRLPAKIVTEGSSKGLGGKPVTN